MNTRVNTIWDLIRHMTTDLEPIPSKEFPFQIYNPWLINLTLANNPQTFKQVYNLNSYNSISKNCYYIHYLSLFFSLPKHKTWFPKIKKQNKYDQDLVDAVCRNFNISERLVEEYLQFLSSEQQQELILKIKKEKE